MSIDFYNFNTKLILFYFFFRVNRITKSDLYQYWYYNHYPIIEKYHMFTNAFDIK